MSEDTYEMPDGVLEAEGVSVVPLARTRLGYEGAGRFYALASESGYFEPSVLYLSEN